MRLFERHRRALATVLVAAQVFAVAHLAVVVHTTSRSGEVASGSFSVEEHLDAAAHAGPHAHTPAPAVRSGEEHCVVAAMLRAATVDGKSPSPALVLQTFDVRLPNPPVSGATSRLQRLLAAPKASPPASLAA